MVSRKRPRLEPLLVTWSILEAASSLRRRDCVCSEPVLGLEQSCVWGARLMLIPQGASVCCMTRSVWPAARTGPASALCRKVCRSSAYLCWYACMRSTDSHWSRATWVQVYVEVRWSWRACLSACTLVSGACANDKEASYNKVGRASKCCSFHTSVLSLTLPYIVLHNKWFHARWAAGWVCDAEDEEEKGSPACERLHLHQSGECNELKMNRKRWAKWHFLHHQLFHKVFLFGSCREKSLWGKIKSHMAEIHTTLISGAQLQTNVPETSYQDKPKHVVYLLLCDF